MIAFSGASVAVIAISGGILAALAGLISWVVVASNSGRNEREQQRLEMLQKALEHPQLDEATRRELLAALAGNRGLALSRLVASGTFWRRAAFSVGWVGFLYTGGMIGLRAAGLMYVPYEVMLPAALVSLALMTLPTALRELGERERAEA